MRKNLFFFIKFTNLNYETDLNKVNEAVKEVTKYFRMELVQQSETVVYAGSFSVDNEINFRS